MREESMNKRDFFLKRCQKWFGSLGTIHIWSHLNWPSLLPIVFDKKRSKQIFKNVAEMTQHDAISVRLLILIIQSFVVRPANLALGRFLFWFVRFFFHLSKRVWGELKQKNPITKLWSEISQVLRKKIFKRVWSAK